MQGMSEGLRTNSGYKLEFLARQVPLPADFRSVRAFSSQDG